ncbi:MAG: tetratricopeptide repeat protein [Chloroflexota bacterium]|jgi:Flp pilus assembly protein TadD
MAADFDRLIEDANQYAQNGDWYRALDVLAEANKLKPRDAGAVSGMAQCALQLGKPEEALTFFQQAVVLAPDSTDVHNNLGIVQAILGKLEAAEGSYQMAITLDPDSSQAWKNLAMLYLKQDTRVKEGVDILSAVVQADQTDSDAWFLLAQCYEEVGDIDSAKELYGKALKHSPDHLSSKEALNRLTQVDIIPERVSDLDRIARPEHAQKLASLKSLKGLKKPTIDPASGLDDVKKN